MVRVLGDIAVDAGTVTRRRERELLGLLVAARGRPVAVDRIVEEIWTVDAPRSAVQVVVSRLRTRLDPERTGPGAIVGTPAGYRLVVPREAVDAWLFEDLAERALAPGRPADRLVLGTRAVELWAGSPYAECHSPALRAEAARLVDLHATVQEARATALLALGHPAAAARLLGAAAPEHPYREQLWALLARAQYACARQADALATLATLRTRLAEDLGVDLSAPARAMERSILTQEAGLVVGGPGATPRACHPRSRTVRRCRAASVTAGLHRSA